MQECLAFGRTGHKIKTCAKERNIYVKKLHGTFTKDELDDTLKCAGPIKSIRLRKKLNTDNEAKEAFIYLHTQHEAAEALRVIYEVYQNWVADVAYSNKIRQRKRYPLKVMNDVWERL